MFGSPLSPRLALLRDSALIITGCVLQALSVVLFLNPADLAAGGISGLALLLNRILPITLPIGVITLLLNLPLFWLGLRHLGGWPTGEPPDPTRLAASRAAALALGAER